MNSSKSESYSLYNLAAAAKLISDYINSKKARAKLNEDEKIFLHALINRINATENILKGWLSVGHLSTYHVIKENKEMLEEIAKEFDEEKENESIKIPSQKELLKESKQMHRNMLIFSYIQAKAIKKSIEEFRESNDPSEDKSHSSEWESETVSNLLDNIDNCLQAVINSIKRDTHIKKKPKKTSSFHDDEHKSKESIAYELHFDDRQMKLLSGKLPIQKIAKKFGASYYPLTQSLDPLVGGEKSKDNIIRNKGICGGLVMVWGDEIIKRGKYLRLPVGDSITTHKQLTQLSQFEQWHKKAAKEKDKSAVSNFIYKDKISLQGVLANILNYIDSESVYLMQTRIYNDPNDSHILGIRQLPNGNIEFYDPNYGIFVFQSIINFECWFIYLYEEYASDKGGEIRVNKMGLQAENAETTLPLYKVVSEENAVEALRQIALKKLRDNGGEKGKWAVILLHACHAMQTAANLLSKELNHSSEIKENFIKLWEEVEKEFSSTYLGGSLEIYNKENDEQLQLKTKAMNVVNNEIKKFKSIEMRSALEELNRRIKKAEEGVTINTLINYWLSDPCGEGNKTYGDIISKYADMADNKKHDVIYELVHHYEISYSRLRLLQFSLLVTIDMIAKQPEFKDISKQIKKILKDPQLTSTSEKIDALTKMKLEKRVNSLFYSKTKNATMENEQYRNLMKILKKIDPTNAESLLSANSHLKGFLDKLEDKKHTKSKKHSVI